MSNRCVVLVCLALCCASWLPALAAGESRVAVVLVREGGTVGVRVAFPASTTEENAVGYLIRAAVDGSWDLTEPKFSRTSTALTATARIQDIGHKRQLTIWPLVGALRGFDEIVVAYVGPSRAGKGAWTNRYVTVDWKAVPTGITYTVVVHRRDFTDLADLQGKGPPVAPKSSPWLVVLVVGLAVAASCVTYFLAKRVVGVAAPETAPSEEEART